MDGKAPQHRPRAGFPSGKSARIPQRRTQQNRNPDVSLIRGIPENENRPAPLPPRRGPLPSRGRHHWLVLSLVRYHAFS